MNSSTGPLPPEERDWPTAAAVTASVLGGAHIVRVHNVAKMVNVVRVADAQGQPPSMPFWLGEAPGRTWELSGEVSALRRDLCSRLDGDPQKTHDWLKGECALDDNAALQVTNYIGAELGALGVMPSDTDIVFERFFDEVMSREFVPLAALLVKAQPQPPVLCEQILDAQRRDGADARETVDHGRDQGAVSQSDQSVRVDGIQKLPRFLGGEHGCLATFDAVLGPAHDAGWIDRHDALARQRLEQHPHGGKALLDGWCRQPVAGHGFDPGGDVQRVDGVEPVAALATACVFVAMLALSRTPAFDHMRGDGAPVRSPPGCP